MLNMSHFKDGSSANAWDYSAWVRTYALFLEERLECYRVLKYDVEADPLRFRELETAGLLEQLPALQQLLFRLLNCQPQGAASCNFVIQLALSMVSGESIKIYNAISDGTVNLVDKFFEMQRHDAMRSLDIYRRAGQQAGKLSEFYEVCKSIDIRRGEKFINIEQPPTSFLTAMEDYVKDAPRVPTVYKDQVKEAEEAPKVVLAIEYHKAPEVQEEVPEAPPSPPPEPVKVETPDSSETDLLGLHETSPDAIELENQNALALAIVPVDTSAPTTNLSSEMGTTGWELALVTVPSSNESAAAASKLAGGLDKLTLDSLYDDAIRQANQITSYNPWETAAPMAGSRMQPVMSQDPFYASTAVATPHSVQMATMAQQQQAFMLQQQMMMGGGSYQPPQPTMNPFGNPYAAAVGVYPYPAMGTGMPLQASNTYTGLI
ncbi:putative clathrin assembly protein [Iris pallida]|uniref:Clathrin assembly protein n=1 Tax=Iris pallida TaxID=29817 RepID=A0AAX6F3S2_IRIPA|nr:putative clathrin assembly protein [Iris pallida]